MGGWWLRAPGGGALKTMGECVVVTNLFLQGPRKIGKSTLLRSVLQGMRDDVGGYFVQRLFQGGEHVGFRLLDMDSDEAYSLNKDVGSLELELWDNLILRRTTDNRWHRFPQVFAKAGVQALEGARLRGKKIILLDELGDIELQAPEFIRAVHDLLASEKKVLGVLKLSDNPFIRGIKKRKDVITYDLRPENHVAVLARVEEFVK